MLHMIKLGQPVVIILHPLFLENLNPICSEPKRFTNGEINRKGEQGISICVPSVASNIGNGAEHRPNQSSKNQCHGQSVNVKPGCF